MSASDAVFLFSYFKGSGDGLHLAWSEDGFHWHALNHDHIFLEGEVGKEKLMRDPFVLPGKDGLFHLVWTAGWHENGIGYACSKDLVNWRPQQFLGVMTHEKEVCNCWAPEIFYDSVRSQYVIYWASSIAGRFPATDHTGDEGLNHRMYFVTTSDFKIFSEAKIFFDGGFNVIDATIVKDDHRYIMFMKDETLDPCEKNIRFSVSDDLFSGFDKVSSPITGAFWAEGPSAIKIAGKWVVYFDKYKANEIGAIQSVDLLSWEDISDQVNFPRGAQHGSVFSVARSQVKHLF
jgi:hypothetical protein